MTTKGFIGGYTKKEGKGIYQFSLDEAKGKINRIDVGYEIEASTYLAHNNETLYAITKLGEDCGIAAFKIEADASLTYLNDCLASKDGTGCYISISPDGKYLFESVYGNGILRQYELNERTGEIEGLVDEIWHQFPLGPKERQDHAHAHYADTTPDGNYLVACDLGTDRVVTYAFDEEGLHEEYVTEVEAGDGPRHLTFSGKGDYAYLVNELSNTVVVMTYEDGRFEAVKRHSTLPESFEGESKLAAVRMSHDGNFIYVSNRGHDSIAVYEVLEAGRHLELVEIVKTEGEFPRDFNITPSDDYIVVAHQEADSVVTVFKRDKDSGRLTLTYRTHTANEGVCVTFLQD
ncbi:lactonase family protein [Staphylococcus massiliensis]|uniref:6-phosphogluconolactonase n=1 Tax=Staphylococcus massiliensis TaxID=555791 RepID=UPI001EDDE691|nr:lactonase family protein [Staphylococcus massiliensis]MCG3399915.1 lactonase family protein [Staphylococcus massiliensis]